MRKTIPNKLISIIVPCYNAGMSLARTLDSVREQEYKNLEVILVNDGSRDNTLEVAERYAELDSRIRVIAQDNAGVSVARNNGLRVARGEYIMFLDADDNYTTPYAITDMMKELLKTKADLCVCNFIHPCFEQHIEGGVYDLTRDDHFLKFYQDFFANGMPWNKIYKRKCITEDFPVGIKFTEDALFNLDNLHNFKKVVVIDKVYYNYYCAPYNPNAQASAVNSIYLQDRFWENKNTIWYMGMKHYDYIINSINKFLPAKMTDMRYVRSFDFLFWDFFLMAKNSFKGLITHAIQAIFKEDLFQESLKDKERYGLKLKDFGENDIESFVQIAYLAFRNIKLFNRKLSMYKTFLGLFGHYFYDLTDHVDTTDILAASYASMSDESTAEAIYVNYLLKMQSEEIESSNCKVIVFNSRAEERKKSKI